MKWKIVMDSSCDMLDMKGLPKDTEFAVVPMHIIVGNKEYVDTKGLDTRKMLKDVSDYEGASRTACPGPEAWMHAFQGAENVIAITISGQLSGSYRSACAAKQMLEEEEAAGRIFILDSCSTGPEMGLLARKARKLIREGKEFDQVCQGLVDYRERTEVFCVLETIENLVKNGRVSKLKAKAAEMMRIFITARGSESGTIEMIGRDRGRDRAYSHLVKRMKKQGKITKILISHCENREGARELSKKLRETFENATIRIQPAGGLCSFYAEAQGLIVAYEKEKKVAVRKD